jgi:hypothetical protein
MKIATFNDFLGDHETSELRCPIKQEVIRRFRRMPNGDVELDALEEKIVVPADTTVRYEPWDMDRGSLLFEDAKRGTLKACTELDILVFPNGEEGAVEPNKGGLHGN